MGNQGAGLCGVVVACLSAGCFVEAVAGVTPRMSTELTDYSGAATTSTHSAWTVAIMTGFYFDILRSSVGYVPTTISTTTSGGPADVKSSGHHVRVDVDVPQIHGRVTASYTTVRSATVDATNAMTPTSDPALPNGRLTAQSQRGGMFFGGYTLAKRKQQPGGRGHHSYSWMASFGLSYSSTTTAGHAAGVTIPGVSSSGLGAQVRVTFAVLQNITSRGFWKPLTPEERAEMRAANKAAQEAQAEKDRIMDEASDKATYTPIPITPLPDAPDPVECRDAYGTVVSC